MARAMKLKADLEGDVLAVTVEDERLDAAVATPFKDEMRRVMDIGGGTVMLDLGRVDFMDSSGLGALIAVLKSMPAKRLLVLTGLQPNVQRVLKLTRMDSVFTIQTASPEAVQAGAA